MSYITGSVIDSASYLEMAGLTRTAASSALVAKEKPGYLWGIGYGDRGYGQSQSSSPTLSTTNRTAGSTVTSINPFWTTVSRIVNWQGFSPELSTYAAEVAADDPIAWWRLGESAGSSAVDAIAGRNLTYNGTHTLGATGAIVDDANTSVTFGGGYAQIDDNAAFALGKVDFSVEAWIKYTTTDFCSWVAIRHKAAPANSNIQIILTVGRINAGDIAAETWAWSDVNTRARTSGTKNDGQWHHVVATYTAADNYLRLYVDGVLEDTRWQGTAAFSSASCSVTVGANVSTIQPLTGDIDEVAYYDSALSPQRVIDHYLAGLNRHLMPADTEEASGATIKALTHGIYIPNAGFETGDFGAWDTVGSTTGDTWSISSEEARTGTYSLRVDSDVDTDGQGRRFVTIASGSGLEGKIVRARGWIKRTAGSSGGQVVIIFRNGGTLLGGSLVSTSVTSSDWTQIEVIGIVPATCNRIDFEFRGGNGGTYFFDDAEFFMSAPTPSYPDLLKLLDENRLTYVPDNMTLTASAASSTRSTSWGTGGSETITAEFSVTFASEDAARYFFNTGGEIRISLDHPSTATPQDSNWNSILDDLLVAFRANGTVRLLGSTGTPSPSLGYYQLTTSYQTIHDGTNTGTSAYSTNDYLIEAKALSQASVVNGSKGSVIWFRVTLTDQHSNTFFDQVNSGTTATLGHLRATAVSSDLLTTAIATPSCSVETSFG